jgi:hypothetical protein
MSRGRVLTRLLRTDIILGNAIVRKFCERGSAYLDSHFDRTSKEGDCVFRHELFECDKKGALESSQPRDIKESTISETARKRRYIKLWYPRI